MFVEFCKVYTQQDEERGKPKKEEGEGGKGGASNATLTRVPNLEFFEFVFPSLSISAVSPPNKTVSSPKSD